jgi:hypothetical protein
MKKICMVGLVVLLMAATAAAQTAASSGISGAITAICKILNNVSLLLYSIAGGVGIVVITLQGIKWAGSAEDPGARKQAKQGIIHAVIGLIIVLLAVYIVMLVFGSKCSIAAAGKAF